MGNVLELKLTVPTEAEEQEALFNRAALLAPKYPALYMLFAIPNGAFLGAGRQKYGARLVAQGLRAGVPDVFLPVPMQHYIEHFNGLFIEMKRRNAKPSDTRPDQIEWHNALRAQGYRVEVCKGWIPAWNTICDYLLLPEGEKLT